MFIQVSPDTFINMDHVIKMSVKPTNEENEAVIILETINKTYSTTFDSIYKATDEFENILKAIEQNKKIYMNDCTWEYII